MLAITSALPAQRYCFHRRSRYVVVEQYRVAAGWRYGRLYRQPASHAPPRRPTLFTRARGPLPPNPRPYLEEVLNHRLGREEAIYRELCHSPLTTWDLVGRLYSTADPWLRRAAKRNVSAHLLKLATEGLVRQDGEYWRSRMAPFCFDKEARHPMTYRAEGAMRMTSNRLGMVQEQDISTVSLLEQRGYRIRLRRTEAGWIDFVSYRGLRPVVFLPPSRAALIARSEGKVKEQIEPRR